VRLFLANINFFFLRPSSSPFRDHVNNEPLSLSSGTPSELLFADQFNTDIAKVKQSIEGVGPTREKKGSKNKVRPRIPRFIYNSLRPVKRRGYPFFPTILLLRKDRSHLCTCEPVIIICACASEWKGGTDKNIWEIKGVSGLIFSIQFPDNHLTLFLMSKLSILWHFFF